MVRHGTLLLPLLVLAGAPGAAASPGPAAPSDAATLPESGSAVVEIRGDLDLDGEISTVDALAILSGVVGKELPAGYRFQPNGDVDCNARVTALDALVVLSHTVGRDVSAFCIGEPIPVGDGTYGNYEEFTQASSHLANYLLGSPIVVEQAGTLTHLGIVAKAAGAQVKAALYADTLGAPGRLLAAVGPVPMSVGRMELAASPVALEAGTYWFMAVYDVGASVGIRQGEVSDVVKYISLSFPSPLPDPFPAPITYTSQGFNYYLRVDHEEAAAAGAAAAPDPASWYGGAAAPVPARRGSTTPPDSASIR